MCTYKLGKAELIKTNLLLFEASAFFRSSSVSETLVDGAGDSRPQVYRTEVLQPQRVSHKSKFHIVS